MSAWHPYPRYFVIADRSWRGVAFIDDPLDQDGLLVTNKDTRWDAPDWRDPDEDLFDPYSDGVHRPECVNDDPVIDDDFEIVAGEEWSLLSVKKAAWLLYPLDHDERWAFCDRHADRHQLSAEDRVLLKEFVG